MHVDEWRRMSVGVSWGKSWSSVCEVWKTCWRRNCDKDESFGFEFLEEFVELELKEDQQNRSQRRIKNEITFYGQ